MIQNLINKGFSFQESKNAINQLELEADEENEQALLYKEIEKQYQKFSKNTTVMNLSNTSHNLCSEKVMTLML